MPKYQRSPVVEVVLELQLVDHISTAKVEKVRTLLKSTFPNEEEVQNFGVHIDLDSGKATVKVENMGYRLRAHDNLSLRIVQTNLVTASHLAPYPGWQAFSQPALRDLKAWFEEVKPVKAIGRVGLRYINRIDIPHTQNRTFETEDYLNVLVKLPQPPLNPLQRYLAHMEIRIGDNSECGALINSSPADSPLFGHDALILDIDVFKVGPIDLDLAQVWPLVERMHNYKNEIFEAVVTDRTRGILGHVD